MKGSLQKKGKNIEDMKMKSINVIDSSRKDTVMAATSSSSKVSGDSPLSAPASDLDTWNYKAKCVNTPQVAENYAQDVNSAMKASRKSKIAFAGSKQINSIIFLARKGHFSHFIEILLLSAIEKE
ncbi:hypothetical protein L2E82_06041 [Cichorium intybus]|uniref:Uncharacterized protein n=1 Tax=Cichorium intybus TaxID=13427 RepID=A0ACB9HAG1_CICIN|nr:hypothetical protein L2E82_06041 [Cichorium intybus]